VVIWRVARRPASKSDGPVLWLALLVLATLRSPFLPQGYAGFPALWLLTLVVATGPATRKSLGWALAAWLGLNTLVPLDAGLDPWELAIVSTLPQIITLAVAVVALRREPGVPDQPRHPASH
jgi:hypothetical protein